ncbi:MAG: HAD family hydrolase [Spirochaetia bacterium]
MSCFAIFDVDHTLLDGSTGKELAVMCVRRRLVPVSVLWKSLILYVRYRIGLLPQSVLEAGIYSLRGVSLQALSQVAEEIFDSHIKPKLYVEALEFIRKERRAGRTVLLATSAPEFIVQPLANCLDIENLLATKFEVEDGLLTGRFQGAPVFGKGKEQRVLELMQRQSVDLGCSSFYSDSCFDLPLLERVKEPHIINPDLKLRRIARKRGWPVYRLRNVAGNRNISELQKEY